jgi:hypothetical protein
VVGAAERILGALAIAAALPTRPPISRRRSTAVPQEKRILLRNSSLAVGRPIAKA